MRKSRFSVEQIVAVLKQAEMGMPVGDLTRQLGISEQTFYRWKKLYSGLQPDQARELKQLQDENARLKKLVAELSLDKRSALHDPGTGRRGDPHPRAATGRRRRPRLPDWSPAAGCGRGRRRDGTRPDP